MSKTSIALLTVAMATVALAGCVSGAPQSTLYVKDALTDDVSEVHVTFTMAQVQAADGTWTTVFEGKERIELLSLSAADAKESLAAFDLAPGQYEGLRIAVSEVTVTLHDGSQQLLNVFGNIVSIADSFTVGADGVDILVDFDLEEGVDMDAGTYTPVVKDIQTSDDDSDGDGIDDVDDTDDDGDGEQDDTDDDSDGDGEDDRPHQRHASSLEELCAGDRDEEMQEATEELNESLEEAAAEREEAYAEAEADREERVLAGNLSAQEQYEEDMAEADAEYEASVAEANAEYDEEIAEIEAEYEACVANRAYDDDDDEADDDDAEGDDAEDDDADDAEDYADARA